MNVHPEIRLGTRGSDLALWQAETVRDLISREAPHREVECVTVKTLGDREQDLKIAEMGRTAVFTAELDHALQEGRIDVAVHSLKDVETTLPDGLVVGAVLPRGPVEDVLVSTVGFDELDDGARIGTGSVRRAAQARRLRPDVNVVPIRGNVPTRLEKLDSGDYDALIMARAGLVRLGLAHRISTVFEPGVFLPAVGQGAICVVTREDADDLLRILKGLSHGPTQHMVTAERACLAAVGAGCNVPMGVFGCLEKDVLRFKAAVFSTTSSRLVEISREFSAEEDASKLGQDVADALLEAGAREILSEELPGE